jgi:hypothetical protein
MATAREERQRWLEERVPIEQRRPLLLEALQNLYERRSLSSGEKTVVGPASIEPSGLAN